MPPVARLGDPSSHGGTIITASPSVTADGRPVARTGDMHSCPLRGHGVTAIGSASSVIVEGRPVIRVGDMAGCGAVIITGSPTVSAD